MGLGIWAMHYIGMLAFHLPVPVLYECQRSSYLSSPPSPRLQWLYSWERNKLTVLSVVAGSTSGRRDRGHALTGMAAMRCPRYIL